MKKICFILIYSFGLFLLSTLFFSCGSIMDIANGGLEHTGNILGIQKAHEDCLASAQTEEEKEICDEKYQKDLDKENDRYADEQ